MASDGVSSCSRRSGGVGREEQSAEGSGPKGKDGKDGVSPKCFCGEHAIMFMLKTSSNPNRLFLRCPFYKICITVRQLHCKFFLWLDEHIGRLGLSDSRFQAEKELGYVEEDEWKHGMEK
ncbi:hypothetical protein Ahy_B05g077754 [Arachis hypogaea]|uniref:GRF-type domain-containing protein n=1 Tax=Arachis hypogaea TaxID=3818 RepID=A0A444Z5I8_ARAHY|nr:hypothetical protein Ahy_B05g077754 [Arachis hypogaea]